jgi:IS5 family transposase
MLVDPDERAVDEDVFEIRIVAEGLEKALPDTLLRPAPEARQECRACTLKQRCTRAPFKKIARDINEDARNHARSLKGTPEFERSSNARKKVEMRFAHLKVQHGFERMRLRGLTGARDEFHLAAIVQNLKTMALRLLGPPRGGVCAPIA